MSGTKTSWEARVGLLLDARKTSTFVWSYKPVDSGFYGGQPRVDWLACDMWGRFWMIEVKYLPPKRTRLSLLVEMTAGQRSALDDVARSAMGIPLVAVGHQSDLYWFHWRDVACLLAPERTENPRLPLASAFLRYTWTGPKGWQHPLFTHVNEHLLVSAPRLMVPGKP